MTKAATRARVIAAGCLLLVIACMVGPPAGAAQQRLAAPPIAHKPLPLPAEAFNSQDYTLSYRVFLNAHKVRRAAGVALKAVHSEPHSLLWRKRLAQTALWLGRERLALREMSYLALHGQTVYQKPAFALASSLSAFTRLTELLQLSLRKHPNAPKLVLEMSSLFQIQGHPHQAIAWLTEAMKRSAHRRYLWEIIVLENSLGAEQKEWVALRAYSHRYGASGHVLMTEASLLYRSGHTGQAFHLLLRHRHQIASSDTAYYHTLGALAWIHQDFPVALQSARTLYGQGAATSTDLTHMILLEKKRHPRTSYLMAAVGFRRYHKPFFFFAMLGIAERLHSRSLLLKTFRILTAKERTQIATNPYYWTGYARYLTLQGEYARAERTYRVALRRFTDNTTIMESYLWFLVATGKAPQLASDLPRWAPIVNTEPALWLPYALSFLALNNPRLALPYLQALVRRRPQDLALLLPYADALAKDGHRGLATSVRRRAFSIILGQKVAPSKSHLHRALRRRADLEQALTTAPLTLPLVEDIAATARTTADRDTVLGYALSHNDFALAYLTLKSYKAHSHGPPWAREATALADHNGMTINALLAHHSLTLPRSDRVTAAERIGEPERAASLAFASLNVSRFDWALARQDRRLLLDQSDRVAGRVEYLKDAGFSNTIGTVSVRHFVTPTVMIKARTRLALQTQTDPTLIGTIPRIDRSGRFTLGISRSSGLYDLTMGERSAVTHFPYGQASWQGALWPHSHQKLQLSYHVRAYDLPSLYIGGTKSGVSLRDTETLTERDSLATRMSYRNFEAQGGGALGTGSVAALNYDHKLRLAYPDITVGGGLSAAHYQGANTLPTQLTPLLPIGTSGIGFFVPQSYVQAGVDLHFGEGYERHYAPDLRPFLDLDLFENSVTHAGYDLTIGIATPLFGLDHLAVYYSRGQGGAGVVNLMQYVGVRYAYNFKP